MAKEIIAKPQVITKDLIGPKMIRISWDWNTTSQTFVPTRIVLSIAEGSNQDESFLELGEKIVSIEMMDIPSDIRQELDSLASSLLQKVVRDEYSR